MAEYKISKLYSGAPSYLEPSENSNYKIPTGTFGLTTDPRTANILKEVSDKLSTGVKHIEIEAITPQIFNEIPQQHLKEVNRLSKLTGVDISVHGPVSDMHTAGITQQGFSKLDREASERIVINTLERSHELNPQGNVPVNFHSAEGIPGSQLLPPSKRTDERKAAKIIVINREDGRMLPADEDIKYYPGKEIKKEVYSPEKTLKILNESKWDSDLNQVFFNKERADEILNKSKPIINPILNEIEKGTLTKERLAEFPEMAKAYREIKSAEVYLEDLHKQVNNFFSKAYEYGDEHQKSELKKISENFAEGLEKDHSLFGYSAAMNNLLLELKKPSVVPRLFVPIEDFAIEKTSETFGNAAFASYKKFKDTSPILLIENPPAGFALSTGEDVRQVVEKSREQFVKKAVEEGISERDAKKQAEKLIGATWDVGHINMLRGAGYNEQEVLKETEKIAPVLKHIHLSDNFGYAHTELPMGMGNVPMKEIMKRLGQKGFEATKIIEAGSWWTHFRTAPVQETLEAMGSPIYSVKMAPYWDQTAEFQKGYYGGMGPTFPQANYETFGGSFSRLPVELGGQINGGAAGNRMSGRGME